ncbi:hypothetical protein MRX96_024397 [Rhipicephalus microplus]
MLCIEQRKGKLGSCAREQQFLRSCANPTC